MKKLFEYAIILSEKKDSKGQITENAQVLAKGDVLAADESQATLVAAREIPEEYMEKLERITLALRPF